jgi:outer membrane protein
MASPAVAAAVTMVVGLATGCSALPNAISPLEGKITTLENPAMVENVEPAGKPVDRSQESTLSATSLLPEELPRHPISISGIETLADAWAAAPLTDPALEALQLQAAARHEEVLAAGARRWPTATLGGAYVVRNDEPSIELPAQAPGLTPSQLPYAPLDQFLAQGQISLPLYTGQRISSEIQAAKVRSASMEHKLAQHLLDRKLQIAHEYLAVLAADHEWEIVTNQVRNLERHLRSAQSLVSSGSASYQELLEAEVAVANARHQALLASQAQEMARAAYNQRLGRPWNAPVNLAPIAMPPVETELASLMDRALSQNSTLQELQTEAAALGYDAEAAAAARLPQVYMLGSYTYNENPFQDPQGLAEAGVGMSWNIFDGGVVRHKANAGRLAAAAATRRRAELADRIQLDVRRAWLQAMAAREGLRPSEQAVSLAEEQLRAVQSRFASGTATSGEVLEGESMRVRALRNHYRSLDAAALASLCLLHATGDL